jgi:hypothetical protein
VNVYLASQLVAVGGNDDILVLKVTDLASQRCYMVCATGAEAFRLRDQYLDAGLDPKVLLVEELTVHGTDELDRSA